MNTLPFFVYGSWTEGMVHFSKIKDFVVEKTDAFTLGSVYRLRVGYPIFIAGGSDRVQGQLLQLKATDFLLGILDEFHGYKPKNENRSIFFRQKIEAVDGTTQQRQEAWVYAMNPRKIPSGAELIHGGDWRQSLTEKPALTNRLTDQQKAYVQKLGISVGREIVPINTEIYRELMRLELIVDKGRRLGLSKLGQEVFRYLP